MNEVEYIDVDIAHKDADADIFPCLSEPYNSPTSHTLTQLSDTNAHVQILISTWEQILHHPRGELCAKLSW